MIPVFIFSIVQSIGSFSFISSSSHNLQILFKYFFCTLLIWRILGICSPYAFESPTETVSFWSKEFIEVVSYKTMLMRGSAIIILLTLIMNWINSDHISKNWVHSLFRIRSHSSSPAEMVNEDDEFTQLEREERNLLNNLYSDKWEDSLSEQEKRVDELEKATRQLRKIHKQQEQLKKEMKRKREWSEIQGTLRLWIKRCIELCFSYFSSILSCLLLGLMTIGGECWVKGVIYSWYTDCIIPYECYIPFHSSLYSSTHFDS